MDNAICVSKLYLFLADTVSLNLISLFFVQIKSVGAKNEPDRLGVIVECPPGGVNISESPKHTNQLLEQEFMYFLYF